MAEWIDARDVLVMSVIGEDSEDEVLINTQLRNHKRHILEESMHQRAVKSVQQDGKLIVKGTKDKMVKNRVKILVKSCTEKWIQLVNKSNLKTQGLEERLLLIHFKEECRFVMDSAKEKVGLIQSEKVHTNDLRKLFVK